MITLGVDLATVDTKTALCAIEWSVGALGRVVHHQVGATDVEIISAARASSVTAIDAPFGWPREWATAVALHRPGHAFRAEGRSSILTSRVTDRWVEAYVRVRPLAVGANLIGATAIRCARLVHAIGHAVDMGQRLEPPFTCEVYPAAALKGWGIEHRLYKGKANAAARVVLIDRLVSAGIPVETDSELRSWLEQSDDALDALIASLVGRAVAVGQTEDVPQEHQAAARAEGWIRLPSKGSMLESLQGGIVDT